MSGSEIRIDQLTGLRVILAPERSGRPGALEVSPVPSDDDAEGECPFCEGREDQTPSELWANRPEGGEADSPGWSQRAIPNLYPVFAPGKEGGEKRPGRADLGISANADPLLASARAGSPDLFGSAPAVGTHEVIVNHPRHIVGLGELSEDELAGAMAAWRTRMAASAETASYVHLIVNSGPDAGASLPHTHAQLYSIPFVPARVARERERFNTYHERTTGGHLLSDIAVEEIRRGERIVAVDDESVLLCPWASSAPYTLWLLPRTPEPRFDRDDRGGPMLARALKALEGALGAQPQLNLWVRTAPRTTEEFHWRIEIAPRLDVGAGFELGTGVDINTLGPEQAAEALRAHI